MTLWDRVLMLPEKSKLASLILWTWPAVNELNLPALRVNASRKQRKLINRCLRSATWFQLWPTASQGRIFRSETQSWQSCLKTRSAATARLLSWPWYRLPPTLSTSRIRLWSSQIERRTSRTRHTSTKTQINGPSCASIRPSWKSWSRNSSNATRSSAVRRTTKLIFYSSSRTASALKKTKTRLSLPSNLARRSSTQQPSRNVNLRRKSSKWTLRCSSVAKRLKTHQHFVMRSKKNNGWSGKNMKIS